MAIIPGIYASQISGHLQTGNYFLISQSLPSAVSTVTFSSIPATYKSLQVRFNLICSNTGQNITIQLNGNGTGYSEHYLYGTGSTTVASGFASQTYTWMLQAGTVGTYPNVGIVDVIDYANTSKYKTIKTLGGANQNTSTGIIEMASGVWQNASATTSLTIAVTVGTFTGTISLYGVS